MKYKSLLIIIVTLNGMCCQGDGTGTGSTGTGTGTVAPGKFVFFYLKRIKD